MNFYRETTLEKEYMIQEIIKYSKFYNRNDARNLRCRNQRTLEFIYITCVVPFKGFA